MQEGFQASIGLGGGVVLWLSLGNERRSGNECATSDWRARDQVSLVNQSGHVGTDRTQRAKKKHTERPRALLWLVGAESSGMGSLAVVTVDARSMGGGNIILPCSTRRDPHQLGSAEATTDAHIEEQSLHPCAQDAPWRLRQGMPVASRMLTWRRTTPPCLSRTSLSTRWPREFARSYGW